MKKSIKKILIVTIIVILAIQLKLFAANITIKTLTNKDIYNVGETVTTTIDWEQGMQATGFTLEYDATKLSFKGASVGEDFYNTQTSGKVVVSWASFEDVDFTNIAFTFTAIETGETTISLTDISGFADGNLSSPDEIDYTTYGAKTISINRYGDISLDKEVNEQDAILLERCLSEKWTENNIEDLTEQQLINADVNLDGFVNELDLEILARHLANWEGYTLPIIYGDVYLDGIVNSKDVGLLAKCLSEEWTENDIKDLTAKQLINADVNLDGHVNELDLNILRKHLVGYEGYTLPILYGDANLDGMVNGKDLIIISKYIEEGIDLESKGMINADLNLDEVVDNLDKAYLLKCLAGQEFFEGFFRLIPLNYGDVNNDGKLDAGDAVLVAEYLEGTREFTEIEKLFADVNLDGIVNKIDEELISLADAGKVKLPARYGDINLDGVINNEDGKLISGYLEGNTELSEIQVIYADLNLDGVVDNIDKAMMFKVIRGEISVPTKFIANSEVRVSKIGVTNSIISGFNISKEGLKVSDLTGSFDKELHIKVLNKNGEELTNDDIVGTGMTIKISMNVCIHEGENTRESVSEVGEYTIVIYGDTTGDGKINAIDALSVIKDINNKIPFTNEVYREAGRIVTASGEKISAIDALAIIKHSNGKYEIEQSKLCDLSDK